MDALKAAKLFKETPKTGDAMRQLLNEGVSDEVILTGISMAAGYLRMPKVATT